MNESDQSKLRYILELARTFTPATRIVSDYRRLGGTASAQTVTSQLEQWVSDGTCEKQKGFGKDYLFALSSKEHDAK